MKAPALLIVVILTAATVAHVILTQSATKDLLPLLILLTLELMIATMIPRIQSRLQLLLKTMQMPFDPAMMFLDLLHKQMLSGT